MPIDSKQLYRSFDLAYNEVQRQVKESVVSEKEVNARLFFFAGYGAKPNIKLELQIGYSTKAEVDGVDLQEMVDEAIRRIGFQRRQEQLQLTAPTVDGELSAEGGEEFSTVTATPPAPGSDEIPL